MPSSEKAKKKKSPRHVCNPNDVATAKYLATTTKACPRCHASIQRESGCAQMLCTKCHTVFNWNTLKEETGVIHNPHFYQLGTEMRQRIVDERASRGIAAGRETRFLAGVAPRGGGCDADAEHDPLCVEFTSPVFMRLLERALKDDPALLRGAMDVHRHAVHCAQVEIPGIDYMLDNPHRFGEQRTRDMRLAYLNGGKPVKLLEEISAAMHPLKFKSSMLIVVDGEKKVTLENFKKQLMRCDTERTKLVKKAELFRTFMAPFADVSGLQAALATWGYAVASPGAASAVAGNNATGFGAGGGGAGGKSYSCSAGTCYLSTCTLGTYAGCGGSSYSCTCAGFLGGDGGSAIFGGGGGGATASFSNGGVNGNGGAGGRGAVVILVLPPPSPPPPSPPPPSPPPPSPPPPPPSPPPSPPLPPPSPPSPPSPPNPPPPDLYSLGAGVNITTVRARSTSTLAHARPSRRCQCVSTACHARGAAAHGRPRRGRGGSRRDSDDIRRRRR